VGVAFSFQLVERIAAAEGANHWFEHRFRADPDAYQCGFDVVLRTDRTMFAAIGDRFDGSVWWIQGIDPLNVLTLVLRSTDRLRLAVATTGNADLLVNVTPYAVSYEETACGTKPAVKAAFTENGVSIPCEPDPDDGSFERCSAGGDVFRTVPYFVPRSSTPATLFADATLLSSAR
jgi:hypothetical protein